MKRYDAYKDNTSLEQVQLGLVEIITGNAMSLLKIKGLSILTQKNRILEQITTALNSRV